MINAIQDENADLFDAIPMSHGTLGFLVGAKIQIIRCKQFIKVVYEPFYSQKVLVLSYLSNLGSVILLAKHHFKHKVIRAQVFQCSTKLMLL